VKISYRYSSAHHSHPRHQTKVSGQLLAPATVILFAAEYKAKWTSERVY